ncbi:hypothetical protein QA612_19605 [Evansella sp. AB-P1]|uniref:hypothetical protein n=1 Tax=Evansella sp. AB-P1 TaxID=3037653 RepID=UPI00241FBDFE|nr:hypothetical protein [Evansella sp. AB-P1]MDG5789667.1 hypothetical protein [Evansella sp. AB-P1]
MDKNIVYKSLYLHYVKGLVLTEVSDETGLSKRIVRDILAGEREPEVATDFFKDRKAGGDFTREYPEPVYYKLNKLDYAQARDRYMIKIEQGKNIKEIRSYLIEDCIEPKQADKLYSILEAYYKDKRLKILDAKLEAIVKILAKPPKWRMTAEGLITVYPIPLLDRDNRVKEVVYKTSRSYYMPDELWSRYTER